MVATVPKFPGVVALASKFPVAMLTVLIFPEHSVPVVPERSVPGFSEHASPEFSVFEHASSDSGHSVSEFPVPGCAVSEFPGHDCAVLHLQSAQSLSLLFPSFLALLSVPFLCLFCLFHFLFS